MDNLTDVISVAELNQQTKFLLENHFINFWVGGEVSNLSKSSLGHYYFILKDDKAQVSCALFKFQAVKLSFALKEGDEVKLTGKVTLYEPRGSYQIVVSNIEPMGLGRLYQQYAILKEQLEKKGYFATAVKKAIPTFPKKVGIITSAAGAALRDIIITLNRRMSQIELIIYPTLVQGKGSEINIATAINTADKRQEVDVLIVARGGGSIEDLWSFNEEIVVEAIYQCSIPIISGVGHETDFTLTDFVADLRAPTPTGAAELVSPNRVELLNRIQHQENALKTYLLNKYYEMSQKVDMLSRLLIDPHTYIERQTQRVLTQQQLLSTRINELLIGLKHRIEKLSYSVIQLKPEVVYYQQNLVNYIQLFKQYSHALLQAKQMKLQQLAIKLASLQPNIQASQNQLNQLQEKIHYSWQILYLNRQQKLQTLSHLLEAIAPQQILERGYSIVTDGKGRVIMADSQVKIKQKLHIQLAQGKLQVEVKDKDTQLDLFD